MRTPRRALTILLAGTLPCLAAGCGAAMPAVSVRVTYTDPLGFGPLSYRVGCAPPNGTVPDPKAICEAIAAQPELVRSGPGRDHSCPPTPSVELRGTYRGKPIDVAFSACLGGQGDLIGRWLSLLPSSGTLDAVRLDRGLGPLTLGQSRSTVRGLLGSAPRVSGGLDVYRPGVAQGFRKTIPITLAVGYDQAGRVQTVVSNLIALTLGGHEIAPTAARGNGLADLLRPWTHIRCGGTAALADHPAVDDHPMTIIESSPDHPTVVISAAPPRACAARVISAHVVG